jgi:hypothetical protein
MADPDRRPLAVGELVTVRPGSSLERVRWDVREVAGLVVACGNLRGRGTGIKVQWPDEPPPTSFDHIDQFQRADDRKLAG